MNRPRVIAKLVGGLGNQLFIYAAARRLAKRNDARLTLDISFFNGDTYFQRDYELPHFALADHDLIQARHIVSGLPAKALRHAERLLAKFGSRLWNRWIVEANARVFDNRLVNCTMNGRDLTLIGYWQDERYFRDIETELRRELAMQLDVDAQSATWADAIKSSSSVAVHFRQQHDVRTVLNRPDNEGLSLGTHYYAAAFQFIRERVSNARFFCFTDCEGAERLLPSHANVNVVSTGKPDSGLRDFWLMRQCQHFIVANSSYSWWAAWLGNGRDKIVVCPTPNSIRFAITPASGWTAISASDMSH